MLIINGRLAGAVQRDELAIVDGLISPNGSPDDIVVDAGGCLVTPGFIDLQINGAFGHDFSENPETIWDVGEMLPRYGVTSFLPTIVTSPPSVFDRAIDVLASGAPSGYSGAHPFGLHFEGPWLSPEMAGAHNSEHLSLPDESMASLWARSGVVSIVTMAPELQGASAVASILSEAGILVSIGHTAADYQTAKASLDGPRPSVTHLFNQMTPFRHRDPGVVGAAWMSEAVCGLIVDGLHSEPDAVRLAWRILGSDRTALVTDSMAAFGIGNGSYVLGSAEVMVDDSGPRLVDGRLAGSVLSLVDALRNLVKWTDASVDEAVLAVTRTPAALVGLTDRGEIRDGSRGDVVVLTESLEIRVTIIGGEVVYDAGVV